jgi:radical SAM protein with 4Fe4S-binding SPASM domain
MQDLYPTLRAGVKLRLSPSSSWIADSRRPDELRLAPEASSIFEKCDGTKTIITIAEELAHAWEFDTAEILDFLVDAAKRGFIVFSATSGSAPVEFIGSPDTYFPRVVSLEVTTTCNIACTYCYGCYGPEKKEHFPYEQIPAFFDMLASRGVVGIELTGGEPLAHPRFADIYRLSFERFNFVALISNGILWKPAHFEVLDAHREKAAVQISIDGSDETTNALVRQKQDTFDRTVATIRRLVELKVLFRVAYVVTRENIRDLKNTARLVRDLGVKMFAVSGADGIGRGSKLTYGDGKSLVNHTSPDAADVMKVVSEVNVEFQDMMYNLRRVQREYEKLYPGEDVRMKAINCGAGHSTVAVRANGDVTGCQYMQDRVAHLGNILEGDPASTFNGEKSCLMRAFYKDSNDPSCMHCTYNGFCANCMVRIYQANRERLVTGKGFCGVVRRTGLDRVFDFTLPAMHNVSGLAQIAGSEAQTATNDRTMPLRLVTT